VKALLLIQGYRCESRTGCFRDAEVNFEGQTTTLITIAVTRTATRIYGHRHARHVEIARAPRPTRETFGVNRGFNRQGVLNVDS
jgi:hypothetical protein